MVYHISSQSLRSQYVRNYFKKYQSALNNFKRRAHCFQLAPDKKPYIEIHDDMYLCFCSIYKHYLLSDNNLFETIPTKYAIERIIMTLSTTYHIACVLEVLSLLNENHAILVLETVRLCMALIYNVGRQPAAQ